MFCQSCGAVDDGAVRCSVCGANDYGPEKPELSNEQIEAQATVIRSNQVQNKPAASSSDGVGCAFIIALVIVGIMWLFGAF